MKLRRRHKPDYRNIARLEVELGLDDRSVERQRAVSRKKVDWMDGGVVDLAKRLHAAAPDLAMRPGAVWPVADHGDITYFNCSVTAASSYTQIIKSPFSEPRSRVVLPTGVRI